MVWQCEDCHRYLADWERCFCEGEGTTVQVVMPDGSIQPRRGNGMQLPGGIGLTLYTVAGGSATEHPPHVGWWPHGSSLPQPKGKPPPEAIRRFRGQTGGQSENLAASIPGVNDADPNDAGGDNTGLGANQAPGNTGSYGAGQNITGSQGGHSQAQPGDNPSAYDPGYYIGVFSGGWPGQPEHPYPAGHAGANTGHGVGDNSGGYSQNQPGGSHADWYHGVDIGDNAGAGVGATPQIFVESPSPIGTNLPYEAQDDHQGGHS